MKVRIEATGHPGDTRVLDADTGEPIRGVFSATWTQESPTSMPVVTLEVNVAEVTTAAGDVHWIGLEFVPAEALAAELARRDREGAA